MKPELLAPAGNKESLIAAINNGADAVYLAGKMFGARGNAQNFSNEEIVEAIKYAHLHNVKIYVTVNTLIKDEEFNEALDFIEFLYVNDVDAIIIQDFGLARVSTIKFPTLSLHASTQMNIHSLQQAQFLKSLGYKRIVLSRECPLEVVKEIIDNVDIEIEVFCHGALCMSYSGNCYLSANIGKRSGNRGLCAQPCRLPYKLFCDDTLLDEQYYLSMKDLNTLEHLNTLVNLGITSLKIEGRMKRSEYVGVVTRSYKEMLETKVFNKKRTYELAVMYNRMFTKGYILNEKNKDITNTFTSNHIGVNIGEVISSERNYALIKTKYKLENNDSIRIVSQTEDAVTINNCQYISSGVIKVRTHHQVDVSSAVLKTTDALLIKEINSVPEKKIPLIGYLSVEDDFLVLNINVLNSPSIKGKIKSNIPVIESSNEEFVSRIIEQLSKTNNTSFFFQKIISNISNVFLPIKEINEMRRQGISLISNLLLERKPKTINNLANLQSKTPYDSTFNILVSIETEEQYQAVKNFQLKDVYTSNIALYQNHTSELLYLPPRIQNDQNDGIGIQNYNINNNNNINNNISISSIYLNVFNSYTVYYLNQLGVKNVGLSIELELEEIYQLVKNYYKNFSDYPNTIVMAYGYYELMIMKHCLINKEKNYNNLHCMECHNHNYYLENKQHDRFCLRGDDACNLKMYHYKPINYLNKLQEIKKNKINNILLAFTIEDFNSTIKIINEFLNVVV